MPIVKGKKARTKEGFSENVRREMKEGRPQKQAVAIAYSEADRSKKKKHMDVKEDKKLIKGMIKKKCMK